MTESPPDGSAGQGNGRFIVDIRIFMLSMTIAMCASFFAGVTMGPDASSSSPLAYTGSTGLTSTLLKGLHNGLGSSNRGSKNSKPPPLNLSPDVIAQSLQHSPSGQHLLVDIANVEATFLDSEERLADAMVQTVKETGLTMLSYHCHKLMPAGISCVGVLMESHISFHTWPEEGVITLDLFTCGPYPLLPNAVETMTRVFGIQRVGSDEEVRVKWSHELRGFRPDEQRQQQQVAGAQTNTVDEYSDLSYMILSPLDVFYKKQLYSNLTKYHRVDIWDIVEVSFYGQWIEAARFLKPERFFIDTKFFFFLLQLDDSPSHEAGLKHGLKEGDPRWETPELATPDRNMFLNGYLIRTSSRDKETHEALVHPAMFAHANPQRVAIVGGREGGALREVLKHRTVQSATLIEPDAELVKVARQLFPAMSDCSNLMGRNKDCFEDDLVTVVHEDSKDYFKTNYGARHGASSAPLLDVILIDEKDPRHAPELYTDQEFISSLVKALSPEGVMMINAGIAPDIDDPRADMGVYHVREQLMQQLESHPDVQALLVYEEPRTGFNDPTAMLVVCKHVSCRSRWYSRSDQVDFAIYERIVQTHSNERALAYFDGTTQFSYSIPPKAFETVYCRREPAPFECAYLHLDPTKELHNLDLDDHRKSSFRVENRTTTATTADGEEEEVSHSSVFATIDIPKGSYIMPKHLASSLVVTHRNLEGLKKNIKVGGGPVSVIEDLLEFIGEHGHESNTDGTNVHVVEIGGSVLIRAVDDERKANVGRWVPPHPSGKTPVFSPVYERHRMSFDVFIVATDDIPAGTELLRPKDLWKSN